MTHPRRILVLAGSTEARQAAMALRSQGAEVTAVVSEPPRGTTPMPVPWRMMAPALPGAFEPLLRRVDAVLDASHGFDHAMSRFGAQAARARGMPVLHVTRAPWAIEEHALWQSAPTVPAAMSAIPATARVFSTTGWASLPDYRGFPGERLFLRQTAVHQRTSEFAFVEPVFGDPPFSMEHEVALFTRLNIDLLIARNLGGLPSRPKLEAAKALNLPVILINRPALPAGSRATQSVDEAVTWAMQA